MRVGLITLAVLLVLGCGDAPEAEKPLDPEVVALIHDLVDGTDYDKRMAALEKLPAHGTVIVKPLADALDRTDVDDAVGAWIAEVLARLGEDAEPAAPALTRRLMRGGDCSATTSHALEMMGAKGVPWLVKAMASDKEKTLVWTADALSDLGPLSVPAVAVLHAALADQRTEVRVAAADALYAIGRPADEAVPALFPLTRDPSEEMRRSAGHALAAIRGTDPQVQARLRRMVLEDPDEYVRPTMLQALESVLGRGPEELAFLQRVAALPDEDTELRDIARLMQLARGVDDAQFVARMAVLPKGSSLEDHLARARALTRSGNNGRSASIPLVLHVLEWAPKTEQRVQAANLLGGLGDVAAADAKTMKALRAHTREEDEEPAVVAACNAALERLNGR